MITTYQYVTVKGMPRPRSTYRANRRNNFRGYGWKGVPIFRGRFYTEQSVRPNRSMKWD